MRLIAVLVGCLLLLCSATSFAASASMAEEVQFYGAYMQGQKVGYASMGERDTTFAGRNVREAYMTSDFIIKLMGQSKTISMQESEYTDPESGELVGASVLMDTGIAMMDQHTRMTRTGNDLLVEFLVDGAVSSSTKVPWQTGTLSGRQLLELREQQIDPESGGAFSATIFSSSQQGALKAEFEYSPLQKLYVDGVEVDAYKVTTRMPSIGIDADSVETPDGTVLKTTALGGLFELRLEDEALAKGPTGSPDLLQMSRVQVSGTKIPQQPIAHLELAPGIGGDLAALFPTTARQRLEGTATAPKLVLDMLGPGQGPPASESAQELARLRGSSLHVQADHPEIVALAKKITKGMPESDEVGRAFAVVQYVYLTLKKEMVPTVPNAVQVLRLGRGDCGEHAVLTSALLRAAGFPTKTLYGLVYAPVYGSGFYYHAWNAVLIEGRWLEVDAALGMFPADATHIVVGESDDLGNPTAIHPLYGKLSFEVLRALQGEFEAQFILRGQGF